MNISSIYKAMRPLLSAAILPCLLAIGTAGCALDADEEVADPLLPTISSPGWIVKCPYSHSLSEDPIVFPGKLGASHLHDFFGNKTASASSTYASMVAGTTTCPPGSGDTAGYWIPALYRNGVKLSPTGSVGGRSTQQKIYYRNSVTSPKVATIPADFRMIAGKGSATSAADNPKLGSHIYWGCSDNSTGKLTAPPTSCSTGFISLHVGFPQCWDGVNIDSADHKSHVAYPSSGRCPSTHPVVIPRIIMRTEFPVGTTTGTITLASGPSFTAHGDFWNTWDQASLDDLTTTCLGGGVDCGTL